MSGTDTSILLIGSSGQIGCELARELARFGEIVAPSHRELDLVDPLAIRDWVDRVRPGLIVNAAAYTAVDRAESEPAVCLRINADAPAFLAAESRRTGAGLIHFSTDYVFDGRSTRPYQEDDTPHPLSAYGRSKLAGEQGVAAAAGAHLVFRTSWIYGARGKNFVLTMLRLAHEQKTLTVVDDQVGAPTSAAAVAAAVAGVMSVLESSAPDARWAERIGPVSGVYHATASGSTSWYEFAHTVLLDDPDLDTQTCRGVKPIPTAAYPTPAARPLYSVLDNEKLHAQFGVRLPSWQDGWRAVAGQLRVNASRA